MTILRLLNRDSEPSCGFTYTDADTGHQSKERNLYALIETATLHRRANGLTIPDRFPELIETQICTRIADNESAVMEGKRDTSCVHRGGEVRRVRCEECCGGKGVNAIVTACTIHGEATQFAKSLSGIKACWDCRERRQIISID